MKKIFKLTAVWLLVLCMTLSLAACGADGGIDQPQPEKKTVISLDSSGLLLSEGETAGLTVTYDGTGSVAYSSSDETVAKVSADGIVSAVSKGNAVITVTDGDNSAVCGVIVGLQNELIDVRQQELKRILAEKYLLTLTVMQNIVVDGEDIYLIQRCDGTPSDLVIQKYNEDNISEWMVLTGFGSGVGFSAEKNENGDLYFWTESNGNSNSEGLTISRFKWEPGTVLVQQGAQSWNFHQSEGAAYASVDQENGLLCVRTASTGGYTFTYYDLRSMSESGNAVPLYAIELDMLTSMLDEDINPTGTSVGQYGFQGFAIDGQYIYQYYGTANSGAFLSVYDMMGNAQYIHRVAEYPDLEYREADGITVAGGKVYIGMATGLSGDRRANVFVWE